jgi:hypothetical protein
MRRLVPDAGGMWSVQPLSVGGATDKDRWYWIQIYVVDTAHSRPFESDDWSDRGIDLPAGFQLIAETTVIRGINNATAPSGFCAPNDGL